MTFSSTRRRPSSVTLLEQAHVLDSNLAVRLKKMVGFRNVAVHDYQKLDLEIVRRIIVDHLDDFLAFVRGDPAKLTAHPRTLLRPGHGHASPTIVNTPEAAVFGLNSGSA